MQCIVTYAAGVYS